MSYEKLEQYQLDKLKKQDPDKLKKYINAIKYADMNCAGCKKFPGWEQGYLELKKLGWKLDPAFITYDRNLIHLIKPKKW